MRTISNLLTFTTLSTLIFFASVATAEQATDVGDAVVHYNAVITDFFNPRIAKLYGIKRSKNRALLTVTVLKKHMGLASLPVKADITASAVNLRNQIKDLNLREITDGGAIYYISEFPVSNEETLDFTLNITPTDGETSTIKFRQHFYTQ
jgi:Domain of unknown function (DUF4426)